MFCFVCAVAQNEKSTKSVTEGNYGVVVTPSYVLLTPGAEETVTVIVELGYEDPVVIYQGNSYDDNNDIIIGDSFIATIKNSTSGGWLHRVAAADTDLVFGMLCEEWGLIIALLAVGAIITLAVFTVRILRVGRSSFYTIAGCAAGSLMVFQTCLNVFGAVDLLPLTGVTFPFVSNGGSAMMSAWGLLAFMKATDTRENASFAIRLSARQRLNEQAHKRVEPIGDPFGREEETDEEN